MPDDPPLKLSQQLVMTPQLQLAIRLLSTPTHELAAVLVSWHDAHPGVLVELSPGEPDPYDDEDRRMTEDDGGTWTPLREHSPFAAAAPPAPTSGGPFVPVFATAPMPAPSRADVWVSGDPPRAKANGRAFPRYRIATDDKDEAREARWLLRALRQRARTYAKVVQGVVDLRRAGDADPTRRAVAEAIGMHESTIERVIAACRFETAGGMFRLVERSRRIADEPLTE